MNFPLTASFKLLALSNQIALHDAQGQLIFYIKQKMFKLKEAIQIYADETQQNELFNIHADSIIDISAGYAIQNTQGDKMGVLKRQGLKSFWRAHYDLTLPSGASLTFREKNPWVKLLDGFLGEIPVVGLVTGYFLNPSYIASLGQQEMLLVKKTPALFEGRFAIESIEGLRFTLEEQQTIVLAIMMMLLLERSRG